MTYSITILVMTKTIRTTLSSTVQGTLLRLARWTLVLFRYKMYTNKDLLLAANIIIVSSLLVYSRYGTEVSDITWCQIIDSLVYCIRLPSRLANFHQSTISVRVSTR